MMLVFLSCEHLRQAECRFFELLRDTKGALSDEYSVIAGRNVILSTFRLNPIN